MKSSIAVTLRRIIWRLFATATCILMCGSLAQPAAADEYDALNFLVGGSVTHDSNLFRRPANLNPLSETISTGYVGLRVDKPYAQQRFQLNVTETAYRYREFSELDFDALDYRGAWLWHLTPRVSGTLSADHNESQVPFEVTTGTQRNVRITDNRVFNVDGWISGGWHLLGGVSQTQQRSEEAVQGVPDFRSASWEAGVKYEALSGRSISFIRRSTRGHYLNTVIGPTSSGFDAFRQDDTEVDADWMLNAHATLTGRLGWVERRNDNFTQGDFSGLAGRLAYDWNPTAKFHAELSARRDITPYVDSFSNSTYEVNDVLLLAPTWQVMPKIKLLLNLEHGQGDFRGSLGAPTRFSRSDTTNNALAGVTWTPLRSLTVGASVEHRRRSSSNAFFNYETTITSVNASLML